MQSTMTGVTVPSASVSAANALFTWQIENPLAAASVTFYSAEPADVVLEKVQERLEASPPGDEPNAVSATVVRRYKGADLNGTVWGEVVDLNGAPNAPFPTQVTIGMTFNTRPLASNDGMEAAVARTLERFVWAKFRPLDSSGHAMEKPSEAAAAEAALA